MRGDANLPEEVEGDVLESCKVDGADKDPASLRERRDQFRGREGGREGGRGGGREGGRMYREKGGETY